MRGLGGWIKNSISHLNHEMVMKLHVKNKSRIQQTRF